MPSEEKVREYLSPLLAGWNICIVDAFGLFGGLVSSWNLDKAHFDAFLSTTGVIVKGFLHDFIHPVKVLNYYGSYMNRKGFWLKLRVDDVLQEPS